MITDKVIKTFAPIQIGTPANELKYVPTLSRTPSPEIETGNNVIMEINETIAETVKKVKLQEKALNIV